MASSTPIHQKMTTTIPLRIFLLTLLIVTHHSLLTNGQGTNDMTTEPPVTMPNPPGEGTCESESPKQSPITINTFGCGGASVPGSSPVEVEEMEDKLERLQERVATLETFVNTLIAQGGGGGSGGTDPPFIGQRFADCQDVSTNGSRVSGVYEIWPRGAPRPCNVWCEMNQGAPLNVVQQRTDATVDFQRSWVEYQRGFGDLSQTGNFWAGLDCMHYLSSQRQYRLRVDLEDFNGQTRQIDYASFSIGPESDRYRLKIFFYDTDVSTQLDAFTNYHNFLPFSTFDNDNDYAIQNCPLEHNGGWWFRDCDNVNLNGAYVPAPGQLISPENGIEWDAWQRMVSMKRARMALVRNFPENTGFNHGPITPAPAAP